MVVAQEEVVALLDEEGGAAERLVLAEDLFRFPDLLAGVALSGCGGNDTYNPTLLAGGNSATTPSFTLAVAPPSSTVMQGSPAVYTATLIAIEGFSGSVIPSVSGLPDGATADTPIKGAPGIRTPGI